jgi:hypothetical protein
MHDAPRASTAWDDMTQDTGARTAGEDAPAEAGGADSVDGVLPGLEPADAGPAAGESLAVAKPLPDAESPSGAESPSDVEPLPEDSEPPRAGPLATDESRPAGDAALAGESRPAGEVALAKDEPLPEGGSLLAPGEPSGAEGLPEAEEAEEPAEDEPAAEGAPSAADEASAGGKPVTVVPGVPRYHDQDCFLIEFLPADELRKMTVHEAEKTGCTPCGACQPE